MPPTEQRLPHGFDPILASSNIRAIKWTADDGEPQLPNAQSGKLEVIFLNGSHYKYDNVSQAIHQALMKAPSTGKAFNLLILQAKPPFPSTKIAPTPEPQTFGHKVD